MKFAMFYEIPVARPWQRDSELRAYRETVEQVKLGDRSVQVHFCVCTGNGDFCSEWHRYGCEAAIVCKIPLTAIHTSYREQYFAKHSALSYRQHCSQCVEHGP